MATRVSPSAYATRPSVVATIRVLGGSPDVRRVSPGSPRGGGGGGVERAQRRVTQEAAMKTKGGGKSGHPARSFSQQLDVFHAASDRPVEMFEGTRLGVDLFRSKYASRRSSQSKR